MEVLLSILDRINEWFQVQMGIVDGYKRLVLDGKRDMDSRGVA